MTFAIDCAAGESASRDAARARSGISATVLPSVVPGRDDRGAWSAIRSTLRISRLAHPSIRSRERCQQPPSAPAYPWDEYWRALVCLLEDSPGARQPLWPHVAISWVNWPVAARLRDSAQTLSQSRCKSDTGAPELLPRSTCPRGDG